MCCLTDIGACCKVFLVDVPYHVWLTEDQQVIVTFQGYWHTIGIDFIEILEALTMEVWLFQFFCLDPSAHATIQKADPPNLAHH